MKKYFPISSILYHIRRCKSSFDEGKNSRTQEKHSRVYKRILLYRIRFYTVFVWRNVEISIQIYVISSKLLYTISLIFFRSGTFTNLNANIFLKQMFTIPAAPWQKLRFMKGYPQSCCRNEKRCPQRAQSRYQFNPISSFILTLFRLRHHRDKYEGK